LRDKTSLPTEDGKQELIDRIKEIITCDFEIKHHFAGVRPTVKDRRPCWNTYKDNRWFISSMVWGLRSNARTSYGKGFIRMDRNKTTDPSIDINRFYKKCNNVLFFIPVWVVSDKHIDVNVSCPSQYIREQGN
jgi:hypothetical protein